MIDATEIARLRALLTAYTDLDERATSALGACHARPDDAEAHWDWQQVDREASRAQDELTSALRANARDLLDAAERGIEDGLQLDESNRLLAQWTGAAEYDRGRDTPASADAHEVWARIVDKPHWALPQIQYVIDARNEAREVLRFANLEVAALRADLARATADSETMAVEIVGVTHRAENYAADLARVTAERDEANADYLRVTIERDEHHRLRLSSDHAMLRIAEERDTARESVRELVGELRQIVEANKVSATGCSCCVAWLTAIDTLLAKHAAPAPTPGAVPDLVFGEPDTEGVRHATTADGERYGVRPTAGLMDEGEVGLTGPWMWWLIGSQAFGCVDTEAEAVAAANAHNRQRLAKAVT